MTNIIGIAGPIAAGKSELAKGLALLVGAERVSFGAYVRQVAEERGILDNRESLQRLGEKLLTELGAEEFTARTLALAPQSDTLVVDGVRHVAISEVLAQLSDSYRLIFVDADGATRSARLEQREGRPVDLAAIDAHSTEIEQPLLRERAHLLADGTDPGAAQDIASQLLAS